MSQHIIYGLIDPLTQELKYIGKSSSGLIRPQQHGRLGFLAKDNNIKKVLWIQGLHDIGLNYEIEVIEECNSTRDASEKEKFWIAYYKFIGVELLNLSRGGEGGRSTRDISNTQTPPKRPYKKELTEWTRGYFVSAIHAIGPRPSLTKLSTFTGMHRSTIYEIMANTHLDVKSALAETALISPTDIKPFKEARNEWKKHYLKEVLAMSGGSISMASDISELHRSTIYQLIDELGINPIVRTMEMNGTPKNKTEKFHTANVQINAPLFVCPHCGIETALRFSGPMGVSA